MPIETILDTWQANPNIVAWRVLPPRPARTCPLPEGLHPALMTALHAQGIDGLYSHQAAAWDHVQAGRHPVMVSGTASGKTLGYHLPVLHRLLTEPETRALYLFPTKALAQDQHNTLRHLLDAGQAALTLATYDGDTPANMRKTIRQHGRVIITNPDMVHTGILPHHTRWADFFSHLRFVVLDEMHIYRGVFGAHMANVLRRLRRVARFYGSYPQFILTSATIGNPEALAAHLVEAPVALIDEDGAAKGTRHFMIYNPPVIKPDLGLRRSALQESVRLTNELAGAGLQTILFGRARRSVELMLSYLRHAWDGAETDIRGYRSGYLARQRRDIERGLRAGTVRAVVATTALELGLDIGEMEAAVLSGYPGSIAGTWQQAGRAGRKAATSLAVLVASANPLDQFLARHPAYFFENSPEQARLDPNHLLILWQHLRCAAFELPFRAGDSFGTVGPDELADWLDVLVQSGDVYEAGGTYFWMADKYPAAQVSLRSASPETVSLLVDAGGTDRTIGEVDMASAAWLVHPEAIYLHESQTYLVESLDFASKAARLRPVAVDYYTEPTRETTISLLDKQAETVAGGLASAHGPVSVTTQVVGYHRIRWFSHERLGQGTVNLPPHELQTTGYWLALQPDLVEKLRTAGLWTNDPNNYGPNWQAQRREARARDSYRCQMCGAPEQHQAHDVHHKIPFRAFASYREANRLDNLITLCRACHGRAELAVRMRSGLAGLAYVLGHLAPLFLMCDRRDIAVHADPQAPFAQKRPAVMIYDLAPGGLGFSEGLYEAHPTLLANAREVVAACPCADGCPACVGPGGEQGRGGKRETAAILQYLSLIN